MNLRTFRFILWAAVAVLGGWLLIDLFTPKSLQQTRTNAAGVGIDVANPYLTLTAADGAAFNMASFKGAHQLVYFGFTFCPDVCPISARKMLVAEALYEQMGQAMPAHSLFITIDPARDTPEIMGIFAENLIDAVLSDWPEEERGNIPLDLTALSGTQAQIDTAAATYRVYAEKVVEGEGRDDYRFNHTDLIYWVKPDGSVQFFSPRQSASEIANILQAAS